MKKLTSPPYKTDNNIWYTRQLFWEQQQLLPRESRIIEPIFSLSSDKPGLINARATFVALDDPTGYEWAEKYLGSWAHWEKLIECPWFAPHLEDWKREIDVKGVNKAVQRIKEIAVGESSQALPANRYIAEKGWEKARGRPSKSEIKGELLKATKRVEEHEEDMKRIGLLKVVNKDG